MKKHYLYWFLSSIAVLCITTEASSAELSVDVSNSGVQITGATSIRVSNMAIDGQPGAYTGEFAWDPKSSSFRLLKKSRDSATKWRATSPTVTFMDGSFSHKLSGLCTKEFGFGFVQAEWNDVKSWINDDTGKLQTFIDTVQIKSAQVKPPGLLVTNLQKQTTDYYGTEYPIGIATYEPYRTSESIMGGSLYLGSSGGKMRVLCDNKTINE